MPNLKPIYTASSIDEVREIAERMINEYPANDLNIRLAINYLLSKEGLSNILNILLERMTDLINYKSFIAKACLHGNIDALKTLKVAYKYYSGFLEEMVEEFFVNTVSDFIDLHRIIESFASIGDLANMDASRFAEMDSRTLAVEIYTQINARSESDEEDNAEMGVVGSESGL